MKIIVAILIFGIIVLVHEFGHFILARINGIEVVDFSIGMGPRLCGFKALGTQFSVRLLPIGGACMMKGEDPELLEQMDDIRQAGDAPKEEKPEIHKELDENSFYAKGVWQRIAVLFAGPGFNFILAFLFSLIVIGIAGFDPAKITAVAENGPAAAAGLLPGDEIIKINHSKIVIGREVESYFAYHELGDAPVRITVKRDGKKVTAEVFPEKFDKYMLGFTYSGEATGSAQVLELVKDYPMEQAGLMVKDVIIGINDTEIKNSGDLAAYFNHNPLKDETLTLTFLRDGTELSVQVTPKFSYTGYTVGLDYNLARQKTSVLGTIRYSAHEVIYWISETAMGLKKLITGKLKSNEIGSAVAVVDIIGQTYEASVEYGLLDTVLNMLYITILLSANIGVMNLLPIPALDGGKLLFCAIEVVRGKPVDREKEGMVHFIGMVLLMILMLFLVFNDIRNIFFR